MMHSFRTQLYILILLVMISPACKTGHRTRAALNGKESIGEINQADSSGLKQGLWKIYEGDVLIAEGTYLGGEPDGLWTYWYENGQKKEEGNYARGMKNGIWVEWYQDGAVMWKGEWENGERQIVSPSETAENTFISFVGRQPQDNILIRDSTYYLRIRIMNIPVTHLFVETDKGSIAKGPEPDLFILQPSTDTVLTLAIGYLRDIEFPDFRNLVREIDFIVR